LSCEIRLRTDIYDEPMAAFFRMVPAVHKQNLPDGRLMYTFYGDEGYRVFVDTANCQIQVWEQSQEFDDDDFGAHMRRKDPWSFSFTSISADEIVKRLRKTAHELISDTIKSELNLDPKLGTVQITMDIPYEVGTWLKRGMAPSLAGRMTGDARNEDIYRYLVPKWVAEGAVNFAQEMRHSRYSYSLAVLNFYWAHHEVIKEIKTKYPRLYKYLPEYLSNGHERAGVTQAEKDAARQNWDRKRKSLITELRNYVMWKCKLTKSELAEWLELDEQKFVWMTKYGADMGYGVALDVIRATGRTPAMTGLDTLNRFWRDVHHRYTIVDSAFLRQLFVEALKQSIKRRHRMGIAQWLELEWGQVADWYRAAGRAFRPDKNQKGAKWSWFVRHSEEWHDQQAIAKMDASTPTDEWTSLIPQHVAGDFLFVPMLSNKDLHIEGESQAHCVGGSTYVEGSKRGDMLIWSIRTRENNRVATLQLNKRVDKVKVKDENGQDKEVDKIVWLRGQCLGKRNSQIEPATSAAADDLIKRYNQHQSIDWEAERERDQLAYEAKKKAAVEKARKAAKHTKRVEKLLKENPLMPLDQARQLAAEQIATEEREKAEKERKKVDDQGRVLSIVDSETDEVPPPITDAEPGWVCPGVEPPEQLTQAAQEFQEAVVALEAPPAPPEVEDTPDDVPDGFQRLVEQALGDEPELELPPAPERTMDEMIARHNEQLAEALDAPTALVNHPQDPQPVDAAA
jgi:hypothetical protein